MIGVLPSLILSHVLGDFVLQPTSWVREKELKKWGSIYLYLHALIHGVLFWVLAGCSNALLIPAIVLLFVHGFIDGLKISLFSKWESWTGFALDQFLHALSIIGIYAVFFLEPSAIPSTDLNSLALFISFFLLATRGGSLLIKHVMKRWSLNEIGLNQSLVDAGLWIGYLERILAFLFITNGWFSAVGFLVAAKSVFRFSDLSRSTDRKLTEYILIGTLLSFLIAVICGLLFTYLMKHYV